MATQRVFGLWLCLVAFAVNAASPPAVTRVEPPSWWAGHSVTSVRLLLAGSNLFGAELKAPAGFTTGRSLVSTGGQYCFVDLTIPRKARPGVVPLRLRTPAGDTPVNFTVQPPMARASGFAGFTPDDVIYLLLPDRFANGDLSNDQPAQSPGLLDRAQPRHYHGGDFAGVSQHLPYLKELGVTALWLTPWYDNVNHLNTREKYTTDNQRSEHGRAVTDYHGYGAVDFYATEEHFGDLAALREMVEAAHAQGFKVIQDQVANHTGPYHPWLKNPPTPTWFNGSAARHLDNSWQTWTIAERNPPPDKLKSTLEGWFINILPDLNQNDPETATYLIQNSLWWVGTTGVDAVRQDTLPYVPRSYWSRWTAALKREHPQLTILGEMFDANPKLVAFFQGGRRQFDGVDSGVEALFDFPLYFALREVFARGQPITKLEEIRAADTNYVNARTLVTFLGLHDTPRFLSEPGATVDGLKQAFTYLFTTRGTPMIYYGDEIAMNGGGDPHNRADFPGGWPDDAHNAFSATGRTATEEAVHAHIRKLITLRRELAALRRGDTAPLLCDATACAFARLDGEMPVIVALNQDSQPRPLALTVPAALAGHEHWQDRLGNGGGKLAGKTLTLELAPHSAVLLTPRPPAVAADQAKSPATVR